MNPKDTNLNDISFQKLLHDEQYYRTIFKKTEKIVSVVFYILNNLETTPKLETHVSNIAGKAHFVHELVLRTLEAKRANAREVLEQFVQALIALDSTLRVAATAGVITNEVEQVMVGEIDTVLRSVSPYLEPTARLSTMFTDASPAPDRRPTPRAAVRSTATTTTGSPTTMSERANATATIDRRTRIATILEAKGDATIKDISEIITDVSEKTIQRELNTMIDEGQVQRQGERRWSRYSLNQNT